MAAFQEILDVLPARYRTLDVSNVQELRLRAGQSPAVVENGAERRLAGLVRQEELSEILQRATQQSAYACTVSVPTRRGRAEPRLPRSRRRFPRRLCCPCRAGCWRRRPRSL